MRTRHVFRERFDGTGERVTPGLRTISLDDPGHAGRYGLEDLARA